MKIYNMNNRVIVRECIDCHRLFFNNTLIMGLCKSCYKDFMNEFKEQNGGHNDIKRTI